jgi:hypothetical protein
MYDPATWPVLSDPASQWKNRKVGLVGGTLLNNVDLILGIKVGKLSIEVFKAATSLILSASDKILGLMILPTMGQLKKKPLSGLALKKSISTLVSK